MVPNHHPGDMHEACREHLGNVQDGLTDAVSRSDV